MFSAGIQTVFEKVSPNKIPLKAEKNKVRKDNSYCKIYVMCQTGTVLECRRLLHVYPGKDLAYAVVYNKVCDGV